MPPNENRVTTKDAKTAKEGNMFRISVSFAPFVATLFLSDHLWKMV